MVVPLLVSLPTHYSSLHLQLATVFTNAPIVVIAYTLIDFACTLFYFILLPYIQLYSTVINAVAAAIPQLLLCYSPVVYQ